MAALKSRLNWLAALLILCISITGLPAHAQEGIDTETVQLGANLYEQNCAVCHGSNGEGRIGARLAKDWPSIRPNERVKSTIANGVAGSVMPAWSQENGGPLSDAEIEAITAYILTWQTGGLILPTLFPTATVRPPVTPVADMEGDPNQGGVLFDQNCAVCHGADGNGRIGARLAKDWPSIRPDLRLRSTIENGVEGSVMPAWSQANGGPLSDQEINNLVAFILTFKPSGEITTAAPTPELAQGEGLTGIVGMLATLLLFGFVVIVILWLQRKR
jgi:mono/diheme cytochrome c family protein